MPPHPFDVARTWLISASAGCGKTRSIERTIEELLKRGTKSEEIMYLLFNKIPGEEFKAKFMAKGISEDSMRWWGTHHAIAYRLMRKETGNFRVLSGKMLKEWGTPFGYRFSDEKTDEFSVSWTNETLSSLERKIFDCREDSLTNSEQKLLDRLEDEQRSSRRFLHTMYLRGALLRDLFPKEVKYVFVDEGQDNGRIQFDYFKRLLERKQILGFMVAGDDKQAINGFKGSSAETFLNFPADRFVALPASYRCAQPVLDYANRVAEKLKIRSPLARISLNPMPGEVIKFTSFYSTLPLLGSACQNKSVLVVSRLNYILGHVKKDFRDAGIPIFSVTHDRIRSIIEIFRRIKRTGIITAVDYEFLKPNEKGAGFLKRDSYWPRGFFKNKKDEESSDQSPLFDLSDYLSQMSATPLEDARSLGLNPLFVSDVSSGGPPPERFRGDSDDVVYVYRMIEKYGIDYRPVMCHTVHSSKGLEADLVIVLTDISQKIEEERRKNSDEDLRVWYVAFTRAKESLWITPYKDRGFLHFLP